MMMNNNLLVVELVVLLLAAAAVAAAPGRLHRTESVHLRIGAFLTTTFFSGLGKEKIDIGN